MTGAQCRRAGQPWAKDCHMWTRWESSEPSPLRPLSQARLVCRSYIFGPVFLLSVRLWQLANAGAFHCSALSVFTVSCFFSFNASYRLRLWKKEKYFSDHMQSKYKLKKKCIMISRCCGHTCVPFYLMPRGASVIYYIIQLIGDSEWLARCVSVLVCRRKMSICAQFGCKLQRLRLHSYGWTGILHTKMSRF